MKRTKRLVGLATAALIMMSFVVMGCGNSPTAPLIAGDDGVNVPVTHTGGGTDNDMNAKGDYDMK